MLGFQTEFEAARENVADLREKIFINPHSRLPKKRFPPHEMLLLTREKYLVRPLLRASPQHCGGRAFPYEGDVCHRN